MHHAQARADSGGHHNARSEIKVIASKPILMDYLNVGGIKHEIIPPLPLMLGEYLALQVSAPVGVHWHD